MFNVSKLTLCGITGLVLTVPGTAAFARHRECVATCAAPDWRCAPLSKAPNQPPAYSSPEPAPSPPANSPPPQREYYYAQPTVHAETVMVPQMQMVMVPQTVYRQGVSWQRGSSPPPAASPPAYSPPPYSPPAYSPPAYAPPAASPSSCSGSTAVNQMMMMYMLKSMENRQPPAPASSMAASSPGASNAELVERVNNIEKKLDSLIDTLSKRK
ncbi:MAG: hypothetical protein NT069_22775 [Planctomycetota bacterium]|nr:hypothetical protein [Planctomycetota bacterium]